MLCGIEKYEFILKKVVGSLGSVGSHGLVRQHVDFGPVARLILYLLWLFRVEHRVCYIIEYSDREY